MNNHLLDENNHLLPKTYHLLDESYHPQKHSLYLLFLPHKKNGHYKVLCKLKKNNFASLFCFLGIGVKHGTREYPIKGV